jgi:hypothetical protein
MRLSLKESRTKLLNATSLDRKSGICGPKMTGEARPQFFVSPGTHAPFLAPSTAVPGAIRWVENFRSLFMPRSGQFSKEQWGSSLKENWAMHQGVRVSVPL